MLSCKNCDTLCENFLMLTEPCSDNSKTYLYFRKVGFGISEDNTGIEKSEEDESAHTDLRLFSKVTRHLIFSGRIHRHWTKGRNSEVYHNRNTAENIMLMVRLHAELPIINSYLAKKYFFI